MSVKKNRNFLNKSVNSREYRLKQLKSSYDYCLICCKRSGSFYYSCSPSEVRVNRHGNGRAIYNHDYREYKTWKYNRKTQWK